MAAAGGTPARLVLRVGGAAHLRALLLQERKEIIILDVPPGVHYTAGETNTHTTLINGTIRAGRSLAVWQNLMKAISQSWSSLTGQPEEQLLINIAEVDASTVMEAGVILPQPGEEAAWFEHNRARLFALAPDGIKGL